MSGPTHLAALTHLVIGLALAGAPAAQAAPAAPATGVAITSLTTHGVDAAAVPSFAKSLSGGLAAGGLTVTGLDKVRASLKPHAGLVGCETAVCLKRIGTLLQVPLCGKATVEMSGTTTFRIEVVLTAAITGKQIARVERRCELCTLKEAREGLSQAASDAAKKTAGVPGLVPPRTKLQPPPKRRRLVARRVRPTPVTPKFRFVDQGRTWRAAGLVTAGAGVTALIPGIVLMALDGKDAGDGPPTSDRHRWTTRAGGIALLSVGAVLAVTGATMYVIGLLRKNKRVPIVSIILSPKSRGAMAVGRFRF